MKSRLSSEFIYQLFALLIAVIVVHAAYVGVIRPTADAQLQREMEMQAAGGDYVPERSLAVVIRDFHGRRRHDNIARVAKTRAGRPGSSAVH